MLVMTKHSMRAAKGRVFIFISRPACQRSLQEAKARTAGQKGWQLCSYELSTACADLQKDWSVEEGGTIRSRQGADVEARKLTITC